jgi:phage tail protein X
MRVYANQGDTLDAIVWRHLGRTRGVLEAALEANPRLAELGPVLPHGTPVDLPEPAEAKPAERALIQLWD